MLIVCLTKSGAYQGIALDSAPARARESGGVSSKRRRDTAHLPVAASVVAASVIRQRRRDQPPRSPVVLPIVRRPWLARRRACALDARREVLRHGPRGEPPAPVRHRRERDGEPNTPPAVPFRARLVDHLDEQDDVRGTTASTERAWRAVSNRAPAVTIRGRRRTSRAGWRVRELHEQNPSSRR